MTAAADTGIAYGEILDLDGYDAFGNAVNTVCGGAAKRQANIKA